MWMSLAPVTTASRMMRLGQLHDGPRPDLDLRDHLRLVRPDDPHRIGDLGIHAAQQLSTASSDE